MMSKGKYNLIVAAHPDDETLFFGGLLLSRRQKPWRVVCVTDGNADGQGLKRQKQFLKACQKLGVKEALWLGFPDKYEKRLDVKSLIEILTDFPHPREIFTHGILGEYGHPHHQDVSFAVHTAFQGHPSLLSTGWNCFPDQIVKLTAAQYKKKTSILTDIYSSETRRFIHLLPGTALETFAKVSTDEVQALYRFLTGGPLPSLRRMRHYGWLRTQLKEQGPKILPRLF